MLTDNMHAGVFRAAEVCLWSIRLLKRQALDRTLHRRTTYHNQPNTVILLYILCIYSTYFAFLFFAFMQKKLLKICVCAIFFVILSPIIL